MGYGYSFTCKNCKHKYEVFLDSGMFYAESCQRLEKRIESGKCGKKRQQVFKETPYARVNAENIVFICDECKQWKNELDLALYAPVNPDSVICHENDYEYDCDFPDKYRVVMEYTKKCTKCRKPMRLAKDEEFEHLACPKCGYPNQQGILLLWD